MKHVKTEAREQMSVVLYMKAKYPDLLFTTSPAGIKFGGSIRQRMVQGAEMKRMGYIPGTPDLMIFRARKGYFGLMIEMKSENGRVSEDQARFSMKAQAEGYCFRVAYGAAEAITQIDAYLKG